MLLRHRHKVLAAAQTQSSRHFALILLAIPPAPQVATSKLQVHFEAAAHVVKSDAYYHSAVRRPEGAVQQFVEVALNEKWQNARGVRWTITTEQTLVVHKGNRHNGHRRADRISTVTWYNISSERGCGVAVDVRHRAAVAGALARRRRRLDVGQQQVAPVHLVDVAG